MRHNLNLNWLRSFEAAARLLSFTAASVEIGLTQTAVSQHIKALEAHLDTRLFLRRPKSLQLTDTGKAYLTTVREALTMLDMSASGLFGPRRTRTITVRASMALIVWLSSRLDDFLIQHPDTGVKLVTSIWKSPTDQQSVDVDIILASQQNARTDLELLAPEMIVPISSIEGSAAIQAPPDLLQHSPIHILGFDDHWARYLSACGLEVDAVFVDQVDRLLQSLVGNAHNISLPDSDTDDELGWLDGLFNDLDAIGDGQEEVDNVERD